MRYEMCVKMRRCTTALIFMLVMSLLQCHPGFAESQGRHSILIIYPFDRSLPFAARFFSGLTASLELHDLNTFEIFQENLDLDRIESSEYLESLAACFNIKYASKNFDAIVTLGDWSLDFLLGRCNSLSPGAPVLAALVSKEKSTSEDSGRKIISVLGDSDIFGQTMDLILHLQPNVRKINVVSGAHRIERTRWIYEREAVTQYRDGLEFTFMTGMRYYELLSAVKGLSSDDAILFLSFISDSAGRSYNSSSVAGQLSTTAGCPVYGVTDTYSGMVGGSMVPVYRQGFVAGQTLLGIFGLKNLTTEPGEIRVPPLRQVDEQQMVRWRLSERNLPEGYEVINRSPSLLRDYKGHVVLALLFFFAQSALVFRLFVLGRIRRKSELALRGTCRELEANQEELRRARALQENALEDLRESEATLQSILASIPVGVLMIDAGTGRVRMGNRAATELLGTPIGEIPGSPCPDCFAPFIAGDEPRISPDGTNSFEEWIVNGRGRESYVLKTVDRVSLGGRTYLIGCLLDITGRKAAEREAREKEEQLVHADKMISLGIMAAGIGHEIHNPNNFILLNAPMLKKTWEGVLGKLDQYAEENGDFFIGKLPYSRVRKHMPVLLEGIIEGSKRIRTIVRDMKEFVSSKDSEKSEKVDINAVLRTSLSLLASKLNKSTDNLVVEYGENVPMVEANAHRLEQVAINLILNGAESLADKGKLLSIRSYYEPERAGVVLEVRDNGVGIETENLKRVFDPFFTTKRETGGTGLGLAISQRIIEAYGGRIVIDSTAGEGTIAIMELPACTED